MTDKVQKIREEVERLKSNLIHGACASQVAMETRCKEEAYNEVLAILDSMQEEPAPKIFEDMLNAKTPTESLGISAEEHEKIIDLCLYGKEPEMVDVDDLPKEEPVSEDLEEAAIMHFKDVMEYEVKTGLKMANITSFKAGAKWQFNQLEKNRLAACDRASKEEIEREQDFCDKIIIGEHRQPTYSDAIEYGINWQKEKMMSKAVERKVLVSPCGIPCIDATELYDYDDDKVKVIIIKDK